MNDGGHDDRDATQVRLDGFVAVVPKCL